jgi:RimJ/RimL family protein N-acetyltransferase
MGRKSSVSLKNPKSGSRPYVLKGERIGFKTLHKDDAPIAARWFTNLDLITCLSARGRAETLESEQAWFDRALKGSDDQVHFAIYEMTTDRYIGGCGLFQIKPMNCAMMGICIGDPTAWNKGYGSEAARLIAEYGIFFLNLYNVRLGVYSYNERGRRAYLKAGYREAGRVRGVIVAGGGQRYDEIIMDITRDDVDLSRMRKIVPQLQQAASAASDASENGR